MAEHGSGFEQLTWDDLTSWAGAKILSRGKSYKRQVSDLRRTNDGGILAWVHGTKRYVTVARRDSSGTLSAVCSCPYTWSPCKHSVAAVLAHLDSVKKQARCSAGREERQAAQVDRRPFKSRNRRCILGDFHRDQLLLPGAGKSSVYPICNGTDYSSAGEFRTT